MMKTNPIQFVTTKEAGYMFEMHIRTAQRIFSKIRFVLKKQRHQKILIQELFDYMGIDRNYPWPITG